MRDFFGALRADIAATKGDAYSDGSSVLIADIAELVTCDGPGETAESALGIIGDAALIHQHGEVVWLGPATEAPAADRAVSLRGRTMVPGFVDSHTHLIFAGDRSAEFAARMTGVPYDGGGIATTVAATRAASDDDLRAGLRRLAAEFRASGITTFEAKSGYGLTTADESRALRIAAETTAETTYLGAHARSRACAGSGSRPRGWSRCCSRGRRSGR